MLDMMSTYPPGLWGHPYFVGPLLSGMGNTLTVFTSACSGPVVAMVWEGLDVVKGECQALLAPHMCPYTLVASLSKAASPDLLRPSCKRLMRV